MGRASSNRPAALLAAQEAPVLRVLVLFHRRLAQLPVSLFVQVGCASAAILCALAKAVVLLHRAGSNRFLFAVAPLPNFALQATAFGRA